MDFVEIAATIATVLGVIYTAALAVTKLIPGESDDAFVEKWIGGPRNWLAKWVLGHKSDSSAK